MREYGVYEAKTKLPDLIRQVQQGERVTITNRGEPVADLVPSARHSAAQTKNAILAIRTLRSAVTNEAEYNEMRLRGRR